MEKTPSHPCLAKAICLATRQTRPITFHPIEIILSTLISSVGLIHYLNTQSAYSKYYTTTLTITRPKPTTYTNMK